MAGYTKAQFDSLYSFRAERYIGGKTDSTRPEVRLSYHSRFMRPILADFWSSIVPGILPITSSDLVVVAGCAFGWGVDALVSLTGCTAVGVDISDYVDVAKGTDENQDLIDRIRAVGLDETTGQGLRVFDAYKTTGARTVSVVLKEDMLSNRSRNVVKQALGNQIPTWVITEDMIQEMTDAEILNWKTESVKLGPSVNFAHLIRNESLRTADELFALTQHKIIVGKGEKVIG